MGFVKEFKEFAVKGNVMDMAVGVIIGGAFGKIVTSLVNDIMMPLISKRCFQFGCEDNKKGVHSQILHRLCTPRDGS